VTALGTVAAVAAAGVAGYLAGTFPSADLASRMAKRDVDLRTTGSNNPGALNAAQQLGTRWGVAVLVADATKGAVGAVIGRMLAGNAGGYLAATASIGGHIAPVWSGFRGGKGVATSAGACLAVFPAYFPIDAAVAAIAAVRSGNAETSVRVSAVIWTLSASVWWRRKWPNLWGPEPSIGLPAFAAAGSAMIIAKFALAARAVPTR
jgi:glycerol-3-phosphate acyltransferase PlsY